MSGPYLIRRLRTADLDRILEIEHASFGKDAYDRNLFAEYLRKCGELFLVALQRKRICGYMITCTRADGTGAEVISLAVHPKFRGKGAASALMACSLRRLRRRAVPRVSLMVKLTNHAARRFYEKWGFVKVRFVKRYYEDGKDGIRMVLRQIPTPR
jgi:[ribosomal protein S18]-alanine N-acetyltransferase